MADTDLTDSLRWNERLSLLVQYLVAAAMLGCVVFSVVQLGQYLLPGWHGSYLVVVSCLVALEAMYAQRALRRKMIFSREWLLYRLAEWVVLVLVLKILLYVLYGFNQLWVDLPLWRQGFLDNFFTNEFTFALFVVFMVWVLAGLISEDLVKLEGDERLLWEEREAYITEQRVEVRRSLANLILLLGSAMIVLAALMRLDWVALWGTQAPIHTSVVNILVYFVLALALLSLTQFSILRVQWHLERIPISRNLTARWTTYGLVFLALLALLVIGLPTHYSIGFLGLLGYLLSILLSIISFVMFILLLPLIILFNLLARLMGRSDAIDSTAIKPFFPPPPPPTPTASWLDILRSALFWLTFLGVIGFSVYHYLQQHQELIQALGHIPFAGGLGRIWRWLVNWLRGVNQTLAATLENSLSRLRARQEAVRLDRPWRFTNPRRMSPRERILFFYLAMVRRGKEQGMPRQPQQTPYEYSQSLSTNLPEVGEDIHGLTDQFVEARYSRHEMTVQRASLVQRYWQRIRRAMRSMFKANP